MKTTSTSTVQPGYKVGIPASVYQLYGLQEGDEFEWTFEDGVLTVAPKRSALITPELESQMIELKESFPHR